MANNGPLGAASNPGFVDRGTCALTHNTPPGPLCASRPSQTQLTHYAQQAAHQLAAATNWIDTRTAVGSFLGAHSFTAGVVAGVAKNLVGSVVGLADLIKTFALAEYYEAHHAQTFWDRFRHSTSFGLAGIQVFGAMAAAAYFWPEFDKKAKEAFDEREVLFKTVAYAFEHPREVFGKIMEEQGKKYEAFKGYRARNTLAGEFQAGVLFGELLLDVLMILDGALAVGKLVAKVPSLLKMLPRLERLSPQLRAATNATAEAAKARLPSESIPTAAVKPPASPLVPPAQTSARAMSNAEKGVFGEAKADAWMDGKDFQKLNGNLVKVGDSPLGQGIDGVWKNASPPPEYVITEAKYGSSRLSTLTDGTKQMSDKWVEDRLNKAVGRATADEIRDSIARGQTEKWLLNVDPSGSVSKIVLH